MALRVWARRVGYATAAFINVVILYVINVRPGWHNAPLLTDAAAQVLVLVNLSLLAGIGANAVYFVTDGPWVKTVGDLTTTTIGLAVLARTWQVFPFDFTAWTFNWALMARIVLVVALIGTAVALVVQSVTLLRLAMSNLGRPGGHALR
ncbi:hypothetical protein [Dactylosporangium matsuzakiense]|uniref:Uncharacterized protein n=1 Tax=Dactylosporangium matsuzakiense TaxID=53360 RepID=A0A9W6KM80_9ACTN|nr:hypothetical protein [Dactylosporangium matsuzakiense]GLL02841.1 hypothetical protein GCM10017581_045830 [Dactylosporangium matsuzakiense]